MFKRPNINICPDCTILLVDDNNTNRLADRLILEEHFSGLKIVEANSGQKALDLLAYEDVEIILLDVIMPDMDGFETAKEISKRYGNRDISIIFITSDSYSENFRDKSIALDAVDYMVRPFDSGLLVSRIALYLQILGKNRELRKINREFRINFDLLNRYVIFSKTDLQGVITEVTDAFCEISGYRREELIGKSHNLLRHPDMPSKLFKEMWGMIKKGNIWSGEVKNRKKNGRFYWVFALISPMIDDNGHHIGYISTRQDITRVKEQEVILQDNQKRLEREIEARRDAEQFAYEILNSDKNLIAVTTSDDVLFLNQAMLDFLGSSSLDAFIQKYGNLERFFSSNREFIKELDYKENWIEMMFSIPNDAPIHMRSFSTRTERIYNLQITRLVTLDERYVFTFSDVTELAQARKYYKEMAIKDHLTQIYNRFYFMDALKRDYALAIRESKPISLLMIDIDHFKSINDTMGHQKGDEVLQTIAKVIQGRLRSSDILARWGGEEFMVLLPSTNEIDALSVAESIRKSIEGYSFEGLEKVTCSLGISTLIKGQNMDKLIRRSDEALYDAKESGRNRVSIR